MPKTPEGKYVYFTSDGKHFHESKDADNHELALEIAEYLFTEKGWDVMSHGELYEIARHLMARYRMSECYDHMNHDIEEPPDNELE